MKMSLWLAETEANQYSSQEIKILACTFTTASMGRLCFLYHCKIKSLLDVCFYSLLRCKYFRNEHKKCDGEEGMEACHARLSVVCSSCSLLADVGITCPSCICT